MFNLISYTELKEAVMSGKVLFYENNDMRFIMPATQENQTWFRDLMKRVMPQTQNKQ